MGKKRSTIEREANIFAVCLLIPGHMLRDEIDKLGGLDMADDKKFKDLCKLFDVTPAMMTLRMSLMGLWK